MSKLLVVEDEVVLLEFYREILEEEFECSVDTAENGKQALELASREAYSLICSDFRMPEMTGGEFLAALRGNPGPNQNTVFVFISAFMSDVNQLKDLYEHVHFLEKPINHSHLTSTIQAILKDVPAG